MSPTGFTGLFSGVWLVGTAGDIGGISVSDAYVVRPVLNIKADATATGTGTSSDPYVIN